MYSCLGGGGPAYKLDLEIVKSASSSWTSHSSSPSSALSESNNSPLSVSTRKPRATRKRPNQTYNEAAALLSTAYPKIFSTKHLINPCNFTRTHYPLSYFESSELLLPFQAIDNSSFLICQPIREKRPFLVKQKVVNSCEKPCQSPEEIKSHVKFLDLSDKQHEDFDVESILDEEIKEGIDSIMGNLSVNNELVGELNACCQMNTCYSFPMGLGCGWNLEIELGMGRNVRALRHVDEGDWWKYPAVSVADITPKLNKVPAEKKKKKSTKTVKLKSLESPKESSIPRASASSSSSSTSSSLNENSIPKSTREISNPEQYSRLLLKLNYDRVLNAWSDRGSPFSDEIPSLDSSGNDIH